MQVWVYSWFAMPLMLSAINGNFIWFLRPAARICMRCLIRYVRRFGGSFPAHRVKTATSFFTTLAISFPVGSLGEEFGWRGVMAPYINTLLDRRFGISRSWKWTPLLQSLITGVIWAVGEIFRSLYQHRIPTHTTLSFLFVLQVWHVPVFYVDAASQSKCNFWQFLMQEPMQVPPPAARPFPAPSLRT